MIQSRKHVPDYYERSRDYQVFLKLLDLVVNASEGDTNYFTSLLSPSHCKARLLPLLAHYVGYNYDYEEKVKLNRILIKNWSALKRQRGSLNGIRMAIALALHTIDDLETADIYKLFNVQRVIETDPYGRESVKLVIYLYHHAYLSKLYDLIEAVRPAGVVIEIIPAVPISASETVVLTDEYRMLGYNYATGKLLNIGDIPIYIQNSWEIMENRISTGTHLVDNEFYDNYHNKLNLALDAYQRIIDTKTGELTGELIRAPYIYKIVDYEEGTSTHDLYVTPEGDKKTLVYTGKYFNLEHSARVLNTCYEIRSSGKPNGYFVSADSWRITDAEKSRVQFYLKDFIIDDKLVKKVYSIDGDEQYEWHIDMESGYFVRDGIGKSVDRSADTVPWDEHCYITKKRYVMNTSASGVMYTTEYFVNKHEDIEDLAGNIILSKKDRYKVSDSTHIGFSEVHNYDMKTTYDHTWLSAHTRSYHNDDDYYTGYLAEDYNDYVTDSGYIDERIKIFPEDISITHITREYDGTNNIGEISVTLGGEVDPDNKNRVKIPISCVDNNLRNISESYVTLNVKLHGDDSFFDVFSYMRFTFENDVVGNNKHILVDWKLAENAQQHYNVYELPDKLAFTAMGTILPRTLTFVNKEDDKKPLIITPKIYDGTTQVPTSFEFTSFVEGGDTQ